MRHVNIPIPEQSLASLYKIVKPIFTIPDINNKRTIMNENDDEYIFKGHQIKLIRPITLDSALINSKNKFYKTCKYYIIDQYIKYQLIKINFNQSQYKETKLVSYNFTSEYISPYYHYLERMNIINASPNYTNNDLSNFLQRFIKDYHHNIDNIFMIDYKGYEIVDDIKHIYYDYSLNEPNTEYNINTPKVKQILDAFDKKN